MYFHKLKTDLKNSRIKSFAVTRTFNPIGTISIDDVIEAFDFAYSMTFGSDGEHRDHRTGGTHRRKNGEIFANTFQGKLCEFAIYETLKDSHKINKPDVSLYNLGKWDSFDFNIDDYIVSIKSTKSFGQLLLLEKKDWNANGEYIPNGNEKYDFTFMVRIKNDPESIMKSNRLLYSDYCEKDKLWELFCDNDWSFDIPGYITQEELVFLINNNYIINKGDLLNGKTPMDADNYYCHLGDMHEFKDTINK